MTPFLENYSGIPGQHDELLDRDGGIQPHWQPVIKAFEGLSSRQRTGHQHDLDRRMAEKVTHFSGRGGNGSDRRIDPLPLVFPEAEWQHLTRGIAQRARLLEKILRDIYGEQRLFASGLLPDQLIHRLDQFLLPAVRLFSKPGNWLMFYAVDIGRMPNGEFIVCHDCSRPPAGLGYALDYRLNLTQQIPGIYGDLPVRRLAGFFQKIQQFLETLAPQTDMPTIALLTPGPANPSYFEHAFLANYLDLVLAQGEDLTVRGERVYLKTLDGLQPIDVLLRRVLDDFADPLELRMDSLIGTPGIVSAIRAGNLTMLNPPGSGLIDTPALMPYLPDLAAELLDEALILDSLPTGWCGDPGVMNAARENLEAQVVIPLNTAGPNTRILVRELAPRQVDELLSAMQENPENYLVQAQPVFSTAPVMEGDRCVPRPVSMRLFSMETAEDFQVMPGGLVRVANRWEDLAVRQSLCHRGKDLWVLAEKPEPWLSLLGSGQAIAPLPLERRQISSRVADNLFWLGRYAARVDSRSRIFRETLATLLRAQQGDSDEGLQELLQFLVYSSGVSQQLSGFESDPLVYLSRLITDAAEPASLVATLETMVHVAGTVREHLSDDNWRILNRMQVRLPRSNAGELTLLQGVIDDLIILHAAFLGLSDDTMPRTQAHRFFNIGRHIEFAMQTINLLRMIFVISGESRVVLWRACLGMTDTLMAYRRRYGSELSPAAIIDLLLLDERMPRSVAFQTRRLYAAVRELPNFHAQDERHNAQYQIVLETRSALQLADATRLIDADGTLTPALVSLLDNTQERLARFSESITQDYFNHAGRRPHQLVKFSS